MYAHTKLTLHILCHYLYCIFGLCLVNFRSSLEIPKVEIYATNWQSTEGQQGPKQGQLVKILISVVISPPGHASWCLRAFLRVQFS